MNTEKPHDRFREILPVPKWVRVYFAGEPVADSRRCLLLRKQGELPVYYCPPEDVRQSWFSAAAENAQVTSQGEGPWPDPPAGARVFDVGHGDEVVERAAWQVLDGTETHAELAGHFAFAWAAMDAWYEEAAQIWVHLHDPYHKLDVRPSSRHVRVELDGQLLAETNRPVLLFETGLPVRYYIPKVDVRMGQFEAGDRTTHCAYKGTAPHYHVPTKRRLHENLAWHYPFPAPPYPGIQNMIAFYQERIGDFMVDGERQGAEQGVWG